MIIYHIVRSGVILSHHSLPLWRTKLYHIIKYQTIIYHTIICHVIICHVAICHAIICHIMIYYKSRMLYRTKPCYFSLTTIPYYITLCFAIIILYNAYHTISYYDKLLCMLYHTILYHSILHQGIPYHSIPYNTIKVIIVPQAIENIKITSAMIKELHAEDRTKPKIVSNPIFILCSVCLLVPLSPCFSIIIIRACYYYYYYHY